MTIYGSPQSKTDIINFNISHKNKNGKMMV